MEVTEILINKLMALYDAELEIVDNLPSIIEAVSDEDLEQILKDHLRETKKQVTRLEEAFKLLDEEPRRLEGEAIRGLVQDAEWNIDNLKEGEMRDLALTGAATYVEHYEIAGYDSAVMLASLCGEDDLAELLEETRDEEIMALEKLMDMVTIIGDQVVS